MNILNIFKSVDILNVLAGNYMEVFSKYFIVAAIPILIFAMINCFMGHRVFKVLVGLTGTFIGGLLGWGIFIGINLLMKKDMPSISMIVVVTILGALILGFISFKLYKAGAFCMGFVSGVILGVVLMKLLNKNDYVIAAVIGGLLMGLLAIDLYKHMIIILTSVNGALIGTACLSFIMKKDAPIFILKLGAGLAIAGIVVQYILAVAAKKKNEEENEIEDEIEDIKSKRLKKSDKQLDKAKQKKSAKRRTKSKEKKLEKKAEKKTEKVTVKKGNDNAGFFLIDIIIAIAQGIKDKLVYYLNAEDIEDDEDYDDGDYEEDIEYDEDDEDYAEDIEDDEDYEELEEVSEEEEVKNRILKLNLESNVYHKYNYDNKRYPQEEIKKYIRKEPTMDKIDHNVVHDKTIVFKDSDEAHHTYKEIELALERNLQENINIPSFDIDEIGHKLEEELNNSLKVQSDKELEDLIIKQTFQNIDI